MLFWIALFSICSDLVQLFLFPGCDISHQFCHHQFNLFAYPFNIQLRFTCTNAISFVMCFFQVLPYAKMTWYYFWNLSCAKETAEDVLLKCHLPNGVLKAINFFPFCPIEPNEIVNSQLSNQACNKYVYFKTSGKIWKNFTGLVHIFYVSKQPHITSQKFLHFSSFTSGLILNKSQFCAWSFCDGQVDYPQHTHPEKSYLLFSHPTVFFAMHVPHSTQLVTFSLVLISAIPCYAEETAYHISERYLCYKLNFPIFALWDAIYLCLGIS